MLAYASHDRPAAMRTSPRTLGLIIAGHLLAVALALTTKMTIDQIRDPGTDVTFVREVRPPPPPPPSNEQQAKQQSHVTRTDSEVVTSRPPEAEPLDSDPADPPAGGEILLGGSGSGGTTVLPPPDPPHVAVRTGPVFATSDYAVRPPYPASKLRAEEEATLRLRLSIDERGRVTAVEPVGAADPVFFDAARRHILKSWRYRPATVDGSPSATSIVISLSFRLENA